MNRLKAIPKNGFLQWIRIQKFVILGILYIFFNLFISYTYLKSTIDYRADEFHHSPEDMSAIFLWIFGIPISFVIYIIYVKNIKENPKPAKYLLNFPGILLVTSMIIYIIYQQSYFQLLGAYFMIHLFIGGISFLYFKLPVK